MRIGWIDFLNTLPFNFKLVGFNIDIPFKLIKGTPSQINQFLYEGKIDIGFISSAEYIQNFEEYFIFPDLSISAVNKVYSVCVFSNKPVFEVKEIFLTKASKTSRYLTKVIFEIFFNKKVVYKELDNLSQIKNEGVLLIGDKAIENQKKFKYSLDLSSVWYKKTSLPFVFALWCVRKEFFYKNKEDVLQFYNLLKETKETFFSNMEEFLKRENLPVDRQYALKYLKSLDYCLSQEHLKSLDIFSEYLVKLNLISKKPVFRFIK